jgi:hypothetical protein
LSPPVIKWLSAIAETEKTGARIPIASLSFISFLPLLNAC